ncbi:glycosyltransferase family 9 protein [Brumimicrobium aurantiacum]|uniref:Glycosyltransferase family 9 protein n=1 Tax=Brumimicrobium aurantiacum TaxID=1737063 RepID=A0A3E1EXL3_9FLAO|nr:glycosyltransferase family 9 protein [Brumimicrobium aurantiacum]RFC54277.1 glycosyltransferase family 9 protein [Brumimicrobium aurantiacum]
MTKILVIRFSSIGDIVLTSPVIRCIKEQLDNVELHVLTKKQYASLYATNPHVDFLHEWGEENDIVLSDLKIANFDYVIDLHKNLRTSKIKSHLRKESFTFPKLNIQKWLYVNFKWNNMPDIHIVDRYFEAVKPLGVVNDQKGIDFRIKIDFMSFTKRFPGKEKYIAVAIGAQFATKRVPAEVMADILRDLPINIALVGGPDDREVGEEISKLLPNQKVNNTCGALSIHESAQVVKDAQVLITNDTGMMHIGSAFETPIVSIWGNTVPDFGMYPYRPQAPKSYSIHEVKGLKCRPCSKIGFAKCPKKHFKCMMDHDVVDIKGQITSFLEF